jgi:pimeloyl-ACP methyl ester carboxylesterase
MPLAYKSFGEGTPILFVHGWELNNDYDIADFEPIFAHAPGYRRTYIDLPGMGASPADASIVDLQSMYDKIVAFIDQHISPSKFLLVGSSAGGYIARALATHFEPQLLGVHLKVPLIEPQNSRRDLDIAKIIVEDEGAVRQALEGQSQSLGQILVQTPAYIRSLLVKMTATVFPADAMADHEVLDLIRNDQKRYSLELIEKRREVVINKPSLIITGRHDDVTGYRDALRLLDVYPRATFVALDRGVHLLPIDEGDLVQSLVLDWLTRVEEFRNKEHTGATV